MNRQPIYHELNRDFRVVSRWSNRWVAQTRTAERGTRERDCWSDLHRPSTVQSDAIAIMNAKCPDKPQGGLKVGKQS
jgi:hypothetical protein